MITKRQRRCKEMQNSPHKEAGASQEYQQPGYRTLLPEQLLMLHCPSKRKNLHKFYMKIKHGECVETRMAQ